MIRRALLIEFSLFGSLLRWILRRHDGRQPLAFGYGRSLRPLLFVLLALTIVEGGVLEFVLSVLLPGTSWPWVSFALHDYALLWILGLIASLTTRPHLLGPDTLRLRDTVFTEIVLPLAAIVSVTPARRSGFGRTGLKVDGDTAVFTHGDTTITLHLDPAAVTDPRLAGVTRLDITVDDPARFRSRCSEMLSATRR